MDNDHPLGVHESGARGNTRQSEGMVGSTTTVASLQIMQHMLRLPLPTWVRESTLPTPAGRQFRFEGVNTVKHSLGMPRPKLTVSKKVKATATVGVKVQHEMMALD